MAHVSTGGFVVLPGGYGTFEEALEMVTWNQLGIHRLPLLILNSELDFAFVHLVNHKRTESDILCSWQLLLALAETI